MIRSSRRWWIPALGLVLIAVGLWVRASEPPVAPLPSVARPDDTDRGGDAVDSPAQAPEIQPREDRVAVSRPDATLHLTFRRVGDHASVRPRAIDVRCAGEDVPAASEGAGRFRIERPLGGEPLAVLVPGHEPATVARERWKRTASPELLLRSLEGIHGRVVEADGALAAGVPVVALRSELSPSSPW